MKIVNLRAENVKRLSAVEITPEGNLVIIGGLNGQGKTSVLDSIWYALGGKDAQKSTPRPVRDGTKGATVTLTIGEGAEALEVERAWKADGSSLITVRDASGARRTGPQGILDALTGRLSFDPLAFAAMPAKAQRAALLDLVDLPFDLAEHEEKRQRIYNERTDVGRDVKRLQAQVDALPVTVPTVEVTSVADLAREHAETNAAAAAFRAARAQADAAATRLADAEERLEAARSAQVDADAALVAATAALRAYRDPALIEADIAEAEKNADLAAAAAQWARLSEHLEAALAQQEDLSSQIAALDAAKAAALAAAPMPVPGLGIDDDGVTFNGVPLSQASGAETLKVATAIAIAANPTLRVLLIRDGSLLDDSNLALLGDLAAEHDVQVWIERVGTDDPAAIVIEDGHVAVPVSH